MIRHLGWSATALVVLAAFGGCAPTTSDWRVGLDQSPDDADSHWIAIDHVLMPDDPSVTEAMLVMRAPEGDRAVEMTRTKSAADTRARVPHLDGLQSWAVAIDRDDARAFAKGDVWVVELAGADVVDVSRVQTGWLLDDLYTSLENDADEVPNFGARLTPEGTAFAIWAPTARAVSVELLDGREDDGLPMTEDPQTGVWTATTDIDLSGVPYRYAVEVFHPTTAKIETLSVTDPYSLALTTDSLASVVVDLNAEESMPNGWAGHSSPELRAPEDQILYEVHIGDFSGMDESVEDPLDRGTYGAFTKRNTDSAKHLRALGEAGVDTVHLLPTYDLGTIPERRANRVHLTDTVEKTCRLVPDAPVCGTAPADISLIEVLSAYDPMSGDAQALIEAIDEVDDYNWGYDPYHYTVPEGSYARDPDGIARIVEFRTMVKHLHDLGFRVVMDVVYNHTYQSGVGKKSVLDKLVPGYYHRRHPVTGAVETSTCCDNTATERAMMAKLMTDSLIVWARDYRIDGFRFDLMGHQPKEAMLVAREAVRAVDPDTYFYGEGWNFGEVANNARFQQATQLEMAGSEIGTFSDRLRDAVRGGSSFVDGYDLRRGQGLSNGLSTLPNLLQDTDSALTTYRLYADQVRVGLAGNLADFPLTDRTGADVMGRDIPYGDGPTGYAQDPADTINYVSKHDNQTLWDNNQYRTRYSATAAERARMQATGVSFVLFGQGIPFLHMGTELLRSKAYLRDSYNYGHWFNQVDFRGLTHNGRAGLPPAVKDEANWPLIAEIAERSGGRDIPAPREIAATQAAIMDMIQIRRASPLLRLQTKEDILARVRFENTGPDAVPGFIVMRIDDGATDDTIADLDPTMTEMLVVFHHGPGEKRIAFDSGDGLTLHPIQHSGRDPIARRTRITATEIVMPPWTTAVFIRPQF